MICFLFFLVLFVDANEFGSCPGFTIKDGKRKTQKFLSPTDIDSEGISLKELAEIATDDSSLGRLLFKNNLVDQGVNIHYMIADAVNNQVAGEGKFERIGFNLQKMASLDSSDVSSEFRRLNDLSSDDFPGTIHAVRQSLRDLQYTRMGRTSFIPEKTRFTKFAETYHRTVQTTWGRAVLNLNGAQTFMLVHSISTLVKDGNARPWTFDRFLSTVMLVPLGLGAVDDVARSIEAVNWFVTKMPNLWSSFVAPRGYGNLEVGALALKSRRNKLTMLRRAKLNELVHEAFNPVVATGRANWRLAVVDAMEYGSDTLRVFRSWLIDVANQSMFSIGLVRTKVSAFLEYLGLVASSLAKSASRTLPRFARMFDGISFVAEHMKREGTTLRKTTILELGVASRRAAIGAEIDALLKHIDVRMLRPLRSLSSRDTSLLSAKVLPELVEHWASGVDHVDDVISSVARSLWSDSKMLLHPLRTLTPYARKTRRFIMRQVAKWGAKLRPGVSVFKAGLSSTKALAVVTLKTFAAKVSAFMSKATPFLVVLDVAMSVYQVVSAVKLLDQAKLDPDMYEYAVANMVVSSVMLAFSLANAGLIATMTLASFDLIAGGAALIAGLSAVLGVVAFVGVVFMIASIFIMSYFQTRRECREKLSAFHYYTTNLARQLELFFSPKRPVTIFSLLNTVEDVGTFPSYLVVDKLIVNSEDYVASLAPSFVTQFADNGKCLSATQFADDGKCLSAGDDLPRRVQGKLTEVVLPNNMYTQVGWHRCGSRNGCAGRVRRRLRARNSGLHLQAALQSKLAEFMKNPKEMSKIMHIPADSPSSKVTEWLYRGYRYVKHDTECEESTWLTYSDAHMPSFGADRVRKISVIVNANSLMLRTPIMPLPSTDVSDISVQYYIELNGDGVREHEQHSDKVAPLTYTLVIPGLTLNAGNDLDYKYLLHKNTSRDMHLIIQFPAYRRVDDSLRWTGGILDDIQAFCKPTVSHTWHSIDGLTSNRTISLTSSDTAGGNDDNNVSFLVKRGHYQFGVYRKTKTYTLYAVTPSDPSQQEHEKQVRSREDVAKDELKRSQVVIAVLDVLREYYLENRLDNNYQRDNSLVPVIFGDSAHRPTLYFNPLRSKSRYWSFFCARWHNATMHEDFRFDCTDDDLFPNHTMTEVNVTSGGLRVAFRFPELDANTSGSFGSTVHVLLPQDEAPQVTSVRCPSCTRRSVEAAVKSALEARPHQWDSGLTLAQSGLYIKHTQQSNEVTRFYHPSIVVDRYMPYNETSDVMLGYFALGDCFLIRSKLSSLVNATNLYRASGVLHGNVDSSKQLVPVPAYGGANHFIAAQKMKNEAVCSGVHAVDNLFNVYCVSCLSIFLLEVRSSISFDLVTNYVDRNIPTKFFFKSPAVAQYHGVLRFHGRVFQIPYADNYRFVGLLWDFQCALFLRTPNDGTKSDDATCVTYLEENAVASCMDDTEYSACELRATKFTIKMENNLDEVHLSPLALQEITYIANIHPRSHTLTLAKILIPCRMDQLTELTEMTMMFRHQITPSLYECRFSEIKHFFYRGCSFQTRGRVQVISRDPVDQVTRRAVAGFIIIDGVELAQLKTETRADACTVSRMPGVSIGYPLGMVSDLSQSGDLSLLALHKQLSAHESEVEFEVPCVAGFEMLKITFASTNNQNLLHLIWTCFAQYTENIVVSLFTPSNIVLTGIISSNPLVHVKIYNISSNAAEQVETQLDANSSDDSGELFSLQKRQNQKVISGHDPLHAIKTICVCASADEVCASKGLCVKPSTLLTTYQQQLLDPRFLTPENSELYCIWHAERKHCHNKKLFYVMLGHLLAHLDTSSYNDGESLIPGDLTLGIVCFCVTDSCEERLIHHILTSDKLRCNFFVRPLALPRDLNILHNVSQAFRLWPDPDPLSARGRLNAARVEVRTNDCNADRISRLLSFSDDVAAAGLGRVVQRISYQGSVAGVCLHVTSSHALLAQDEIPFPCAHCGPPSRTFSPYLETVLARLNDDMLRIDVRVTDLISMCRSLLSLALFATRHRRSFAHISPKDFFASVHTDRAGYTYFDPLGGVSFFALEKIFHDTPGLGELPTIIVSLLTPIIGNVTLNNTEANRSGVKESLSSLHAIAASAKLMDTSESVEVVAEQLEQAISEFPRLRACTLPINASYSAERYVASHKPDYQIHTNTTEVATTEVFSVLESENSADSVEMLVDTTCFQKLVTMFVCDTQSRTIRKLTVLYDGSSSDPTVSETQTTNLCGPCADGHGGCRRTSELDASDANTIGGNHWLGQSPLTPGPLYRRNLTRRYITESCCLDIRVRPFNEEVACLLAVELIGSDIFQVYTKDVQMRYFTKDRKYRLAPDRQIQSRTEWVLSEKFGRNDDFRELWRWSANTAFSCPEHQSNRTMLSGIIVECLGEATPVVPEVTPRCGAHGNMYAVGQRRTNFPRLTMRGLALNHDGTALYAATSTVIQKVLPEPDNLIFNDTQAEFRGLASAGDALYFLDAASHVVLKLSFNGTKQVYAGQNHYRGTHDGHRLRGATFSELQDIAVRCSISGRVFVYVTEFTLHLTIRLRAINDEDIVESYDSQVPSGRHKIAVSREQSVYLTDTSYHCVHMIRKIPVWNVQAFAGKCEDSGFVDGSARGESQFFKPYSIAVDDHINQNIYIKDANPGIRIIINRVVVYTLAVQRSALFPIYHQYAQYIAVDTNNIYLSDDLPGGDLVQIKLAPDDLHLEKRWCRTTRPQYRHQTTSHSCEFFCKSHTSCVAYWSAGSNCYSWWHGARVARQTFRREGLLPQFRRIRQSEDVPKFCYFADAACDYYPSLITASTGRCRCGRDPKITCRTSTEVCRSSTPVPYCESLLKVQELFCDEALHPQQSAWKMSLDTCIQEPNGTEWRFSCSPKASHAIVIQQFESNSHFGPCSVPINAPITRHKGRMDLYVGLRLPTQPKISMPFWPYMMCGVKCDNRFRQLYLRRGSTAFTRRRLTRPDTEACLCGTVWCEPWEWCDAARNACSKPSQQDTFAFVVTEDSMTCTNSLLALDVKSTIQVALGTCTRHPEKEDIFFRFTCVSGRANELRLQHFTNSTSHCSLDDPCLYGKLLRTWTYRNGYCQNSTLFSWQAGVCEHFF